MRITLYSATGEPMLVLDGIMMEQVERLVVEEGESRALLRRHLRQGAGLLHHLENTMIDVPQIHVLWGPQSLCKAGPPTHWPPEHKWIALKGYLVEGDKVSCPECKTEAERIVAQTRADFGEEQMKVIFGVAP